MSLVEGQELPFFARALYQVLTKRFVILWLCVAAVLAGRWLFLVRARWMRAISKNPFATFASLVVVSYLLLLFVLIPWHAHLIWRDNPSVVSPWGIMAPYITTAGRYTPMAHQEWYVVWSSHHRELPPADFHYRKHRIGLPSPLGERRSSPDFELLDPLRAGPSYAYVYRVRR